jgi:UDP-N-acetylglucosamine--N-acetylmuramyl-(pentapeptide) pyrophosphoryl-undecaprenol N-acetylglucosamine transferase
MKVLVVSGASGGHIFPAVSFIEAILEKDNLAQVQLILPLRSSNLCNIPAYCNVRYICSPKLTLSLNSKNLAALFQLAKSFWQSFKIFTEFKPDIVVGFGSLDSIPLVLLAWFFRSKTLIHEQNVIPGRANRLLSKFVDKVAVSFIKTKDQFSILPEKIVSTGNPLRKDMLRTDKNKAREFFGLAKDKMTILVTGGSQGSQRINTAFAKALKGILDLADIQVIHICGNKDYDDLNQKYQGIDTKVRLLSFSDKMQLAYSASDLAITRAGATTIAELEYFNLPAVIIPYPFAYAHQHNNAKVLELQGRAVIIHDKDLDTDKLKEILVSLISNPVKIDSMRRKVNHPDEKSAAFLLADLAYSLV